MMSDEELNVLYGDLVASVWAADRPRALELAVRAEAEGLEEPLVLVLAAEAEESRLRHGRVVELLRRATELAAGDAEVWRRLALALGRVGDRTGAVGAAERAAKLAPDAYGPAVTAGAAHFAVGELEGAKAHYLRAKVLAPDLAEPLEGLAAIATRQGAHPDSRALAEAALECSPGSVSARLTLARGALGMGQAREAEQRLTDLLQGPTLGDAERIAVLDVRADARDALGRFAEAFADYHTRNALTLATDPPPAGEERRLDQVRRLSRELAATDSTKWRGSSSEDLLGREAAAGHVFLLGFPRSGTTLLEKALSGHPGAVTLEEIDHLGRAAGDLLVQPGGLDRLLALGAAELKRRRATYWAAVRQTLGDGLRGRVLIDKMPLHTLALPVIARLFPDARVLFAVRDPRDVVLSCFRRRFIVNSAMREFLTLDGAAAYYDAVMGFAEQSRRLLPLVVAEVRHERVVSDFDGELERVLALAGLCWNEGVRGFAERARERPRTPSDLQLVGGLNREGLGHWRGYAEPLSPVLPTLAPWVARWGYPPG